jgi:hypothetical protein
MTVLSYFRPSKTLATADPVLRFCTFFAPGIEWKVAKDKKKGDFKGSSHGPSSGVLLQKLSHCNLYIKC